MPTFSREDEAISRWQAIIESAVDGIIVIDASGRIEAFNPAAERLFGYREAEVIGQNVKILMPSPDREAHDGYLRNYLQTGRRKIIGIGREVTAQRRDGSTFPVHLSVGELTIGGEPKFTGIVHDLSSRVEMEAQLREQAALARLGEMAAVVAHEVKNPLAAIRAGVQTLGRQVPADERALAVVDQIVQRIDALSDLMHELLLFARPPRPRTSAVHVEALLSSTIEFLRGDPQMRHLDVAISGEAPPVTADPELLKIVFLNLFVNSGQAMGGRGRVEVHITATDHACRIIVQDRGPGVPREVRDKIFTPFFTTKRRGTGLGLATAKRLLEAHGGSIALQSPPDGGTRMVVELPIVRIDHSMSVS